MIIMTVIIVAVAGFITWDNSRIYRDASNVQLEMQKIKPQTEDGFKYSFEQLRAINPDVNSWITMDGTNIDYPVVRGKDNWYYLNRDVFRKYSLAGSIYMDTRNKPDYSDIYTIIYGHHMKNHLMFSDLDLYKDENFFRTNTTGTLLLPDGEKKLQTVAVLETTEKEKAIFSPNKYTNDLSNLCNFLRKNAIHISEDTLAMIEANPNSYQAIALVTCTNGITGNRTVLIVTTTYDYKHLPDDSPEIDNPSQPNCDDENPQTGDKRRILWWIILSAGCMVAMFVITAFYALSNRRKG